jgi:hypothetical protein
MKVDLVLASPVKLGVPLLPTEADDFGQGKAFDTDVGKALPHLVKTPLSNYGIDPFHCGSLPWGRLQLLSLDRTCLRMKFA